MRGLLCAPSTKQKERGRVPPLLKLISLLLNVENLASIIETAGFTYAVGHMIRAAVGARNNTGHIEFPNGATPFISSCL